MSDINKASRDAVEAAQQGEQFALLLAAVQAAQQTQQQQPQGQVVLPAPQQAAARVPGSPAKWLALGVGGSFLALSLALSFIAVATGAVALTVCVVVLRGVWNDARQGR